MLSGVARETSPGANPNACATGCFTSPGGSPARAGACGCTCPSAGPGPVRSWRPSGGCGHFPLPGRATRGSPRSKRRQDPDPGLPANGFPAAYMRANNHHDVISGDINAALRNNLPYDTPRT
jgi:hypothetical protein